ncbi:WW domain-containing protein [Caenorhabditis elegans]|uniref:WW domain-containing protein n=1 Tax=Caenorhabditis elegans TaxID=6239 RepID=Q9XVA3_CAEEL|nr:WW domain-containing protein [Caenorhabditis elegans]CAB04059.1 WW domain-containing protein [Caenorhabditis elegans]|eukprot:NP_496901.1 Uncharacterized protein CELE_F08G2.5 [Caenorhabditis elegans]
MRKLSTRPLPLGDGFFDSSSDSSESELSDKDDEDRYSDSTVSTLTSQDRRDTQGCQYPRSSELPISESPAPRARRARKQRSKRKSVKPPNTSSDDSSDDSDDSSSSSSSDDSVSSKSSTNSSDSSPCRCRDGLAEWEQRHGRRWHPYGRNGTWEPYRNRRRGIYDCENSPRETYSNGA